MSLELCILASGSSGNCSVLRAQTGAMLIDAGIGPRTTARRLEGTGVSLADLRAICITHLDHDHLSFAWLNTIVRRGIRLHCHASAAGELLHRLRRQEHPHTEAMRALIRPFDDRPFEPLADVQFLPVRLPHDRAGSHAYVIACNGCRIGYATDLGRVTAELLERFSDLDLLAIESNYDVDMQRASGRPWFLQNRIMNGHGHLSNEQAFEAVRAILNRAQQSRRPMPAHIVLLHRSRECNCPELVRRVFCRDTRIAPRLTLSHQSVRTEWLRMMPRAPLCGEQLLLAWA
jgi:phosphoribosyl 1,2-cyclic phosphodiesterase